MAVTTRVHPSRPAPGAIRAAARVLRAGGLVAFPTETVYGLGADALNQAAVKKIFAAKGRPATNPLIVHLSDSGAARELAGEWPAPAGALAKAFWPGPLTLVVPKRPEVPDQVTAGLGTVALRVPAHPVATALLREARLPLAAPSANRSGEVSPTTAAHVERALGDAVDMILDAGSTEVGIESTVVDLTGRWPVLLRPGGVSLERLRSVVGRLEVQEGAGEPGVAQSSPGTLARHYAPRAKLRIVERAALARLGQHQGRVGAVVLGAAGLSANARIIRLPDDPAGYARGLYAALHELDDSGCDLILVEGVPDTPGWEAVRDRLRRAAEVSPAAGLS